MKSTLLLIGIGLSFNSAWAQVITNKPYEPNYTNSGLDEKKCTGQISDLNCYAKIINESAHRMNVRDGVVEPRPDEVYEQGPGAPMPQKKKVYHGQRILVDTQDHRSCEEVKDFVQKTGALNAKKDGSLDIQDMCAPSVERYRTITIMGESYEEYLTPIKLDFLKRTDSSLGVDTRNLTYGLVATLGALWVAPESVSKWDKEEIKSVGLLTKWKHNVKIGPVIDHDDPVINYVGHPISGAAYYTLARSNGASPLASFGYSVLISTFFWEYGFEALAEIPSIQDLILTPLIGSILGEIFYKWSQRIESKGGKVLGSERLGSTLLFVLNPAKGLSNQINKLVGSNLIQNAESNLVVSRRSVTGQPGDPMSTYIGLEFEFKF